MLEPHFEMQAGVFARFEGASLWVTCGRTAGAASGKSMEWSSARAVVGSMNGCRLDSTSESRGVWNCLYVVAVK